MPGAQRCSSLVRKEKGIGNRVVRLAVACLKKEVGKVPVVTVVPVDLLEGSSIQTLKQGKERAWELGSDTRRSRLEENRGKI